MFSSFIHHGNNIEDPTDADLQECLLKMPFLSPQNTRFMENSVLNSHNEG